MLKFTASVREWMSQDEKNIIAIHCKGGKGRTTRVVVCVCYKSRYSYHAFFDVSMALSHSMRWV